jgi:hypothetical protein
MAHEKDATIAAERKRNNLSENESGFLATIEGDAAHMACRSIARSLPLQCLPVIVGGASHAAAGA